METFLSPWLGGNIPNGATWSENIVFSSPFSIPPMVFLGNCQTAPGTEESKLIVFISNVTTTGCTINVLNNSPLYIFFGNEWNIMVLGF
jgi:hypothetical protein